MKKEVGGTSTAAPRVGVVLEFEGWGTVNDPDSGVGVVGYQEYVCLRGKVGCAMDILRHQGKGGDHEGGPRPGVIGGALERRQTVARGMLEETRAARSRRKWRAPHTEKQDREEEDEEDEESSMQRVALRPRSSRIKAKKEKMESEKYSDSQMGNACQDFCHASRCDDEMSGQEKMKHRKRAKNVKNLSEYDANHEEIIYNTAKPSSLHFTCQPLVHTKKTDGENKYPSNAICHGRNDDFENVHSDVSKEDSQNGFLQAAKKELFEGDFRNEIPKMDIEDTNFSAFTPIQHFHDTQRIPKRAKKKELPFAMSASSLQQEQRLKRQQEAIGEGGVTEKTILGRLGDSRYTREILRRLLAQGIVNRCGKGGSNDPFLYSLNKVGNLMMGNVICSPDMIDPGLEVRLRRIEGKIKNFLDSQSGYITEKRIRIEELEFFKIPTKFESVEQVGDNTGTGKALRRLVITGVVEREGRGGIGDPYRYRRNPEYDGCDTRRRIDMKCSPTASNSSPGTLAVHHSNFICFAPPPLPEENSYPMHANESYRKEGLEGSNLATSNDGPKCGLPPFIGECLPDIHDSFDILNESGVADSEKTRGSYSQHHWTVEVEKDFSSNPNGKEQKRGKCCHKNGVEKTASEGSFSDSYSEFIDVTNIMASMSSKPGFDDLENEQY
eukprot:754197-Hanusia_phi.AAC.1